MPSPFQPIPGTRTIPGGIFVDHWGTLLRRPDAGFALDVGELEFQEGAVDALFHAHEQGWNIYLIGNEFSVPQGLLPYARWQELEAHIIQMLQRHGVPVTRSYICTDDPEGKKPHNRDSVYMLPNTGPMYHAAQNDGINLSKCWVIGDSTLELVAGWRAGCHTVGVRTGDAVNDGALHVEPEVFANNLTDAIGLIVSGTAIPRL